MDGMAEEKQHTGAWNKLNLLEALQALSIKSFTKGLG
jgi:hypothetical protein